VQDRFPVDIEKASASHNFAYGKKSFKCGFKQRRQSRFERFEFDEKISASNYTYFLSRIRIMSPADSYGTEKVNPTFDVTGFD